MLEPTSKNWSYEPCVLCIIGLADTRSVTVARKTENGVTRYYAVSTNLSDDSLTRLVERVHAAWIKPDDSPLYDAHYAAQYAYACGYYD